MFKTKMGKFLQRHFKVLIAYTALGILLTVYANLQPRLFTRSVLTATLNQSMALVLASMGQMAVILTAGIDLSIGPIVSLANVLASVLFPDHVLGVIAASLVILAVGALAGLINGILVVYGRLQPIIVTLATASIYSGFALMLRPRPGGYVPSWYGELLTGRLLDWVPASLVLLVVVLIGIWYPFRRSALGLAVYAVGSDERAAYMSGLNVHRAKVMAYVLAGFLAALAGLFLTAQTSSGDATIGGVYTLQSIGAVVLGGTSLFGGSGSVAGTIAGAFVIRIISSVLFFAGINPLSQPLFEGLVLLIAISLGAIRTFTLHNRLDVMR